MPSSAIPFFLVLFVAIHALQQTYNVSELAPFNIDRHHSLSTDSPTTRAVRNSPELQKRILPAYDFLETVYNVIAKRRQRNDPLACNLRRVLWVVISLINVKVRQVGEFVDDCHSRLNGNDAVPRGELTRAFVDGAQELIVDVVDALYIAMKDIDVIPKGPDSNWTKGAFPPSGWDLKWAGQTCKVHNLYGYRIRGRWYLGASVTNNHVDAFLPDWGRATIFEYVPKDFSESLALPWFKWGTKDEVEMGTTFLNRWAGRLGLAMASRMDFDENPAAQEALRLNELAVDQAEDAVTPSNIAILALPLVLSLIPVAFIADLNTCAMLWYIIFTDVFSALPLLIKGIELLDSTTIKRGQVAAYHMGNETLSQVEVWAAECHGQDSFRVHGIVFICISVMAILAGVVAEVLAQRVMKRRREEDGQNAIGPFGTALFDSTAYSTLGGAREADREKRLSLQLSQWMTRRRDGKRDVEGLDEQFYEDYGGMDGDAPGKRNWGRQWWRLFPWWRSRTDDDFDDVLRRAGVADSVVQVSTSTITSQCTETQTTDAEAPSEAVTDRSDEIG